MSTGTPILGLDHITIAVNDIERAQHSYEHVLGVSADGSGAIDGAAAVVFHRSNVTLCLRQDSGPEGLRQLCFRVDSAERMERRLQRVGIEVVSRASDPLIEASAGSGTGKVVAMAIDPDHARGIDMAFVERSDQHLIDRSQDTPNDAVIGLDHVVIESGEAEATAFVLAARLGLDLRMDMSRPEWGARLMFYRCGDLILEVMQSLTPKDEDSAQHDRLFGLSWRVADADAAQQRMTKRGLDVSAARDGRKPGTRVFTVRDHTCRVPTLILQPPGA